MNVLGIKVLFKLTILLLREVCCAFLDTCIYEHRCKHKQMLKTENTSETVFVSSENEQKTQKKAKNTQMNPKKILMKVNLYYDETQNKCI